MQSSRLTRWTLIAGFFACSSNAPPPGSGEQSTAPEGSGGARGIGASGSSGSSSGASSASATTTGTTGTTTAGSSATGSGGAGAGSGSGGTGQAGSGSDRDASHAGGAGSSGLTDAASADAAGTIGVNDSGRGSGACASDRMAVGSIRLTASGETPAAFADAYNAELIALTTAGPLLIALSGMSGATGAARADLGALAESPQQGARFAGTRVSIPLSIDASGTIRIAATDARFELEFVPPANGVLLPIAAVALEAKLAAGCGALTVAKMNLLVPVTAGDLAFHGSTVAALMGVASASYGGGSANAWPLELSGTAQRVFAPGVAADDGGIAP